MISRKQALTAVSTKFIPPTGSGERGPRVRVKSLAFGGPRKYYPWLDGHGVEQNHLRAFELFADELGWNEAEDVWHAGGTDEGYVFVREVVR